MPFLKIDKGLEAEADGVQMMKPIGGLDALLERARKLGVFGTKERSVINQPSQDRHRRDRGTAVRDRRTGLQTRAGADHRARSQHQEPGQGGLPRPSWSRS